MRKLLLSLPALLIAAGLFTPAGAQGAYATGMQLAYADWIDMEGKTGTFAVAVGWRVLDSEQGFLSRGAVAQGTCTKDTFENGWSISCMGRGKGREVGLEEYEVDPLLSSARLGFRVAGFQHAASWRGRGRSPQGFAGVQTGNTAVMADAGFYRGAKTRGRVFGHSYVSQGWLDWGFMLQGGAAAAELGERGIEVDWRPDGTVVVTRTISSP